MVRRSSLASSRVELVFHGKASHAAGAPDLGINALEAVIQTFVGINARRLQMRGDARVHGIITHGGDAVNIIPARASARFSVRARDRAYQRQLVAMLRGAAEAGAAATGAHLEWTETRGYDNTVPNTTIADVMARNMAAVGRPVAEPAPNERMGSTDMGDISQILPAIHAYLAIVPDTIANHTVEFAAAAASPAGDKAVVDGATALAMTAADLLADESLLAEARASFAQQLAAGEVAGREGWLTRGKAYTGKGTAGYETTPASRRSFTSAGENPQPVRTSSVCAPRSGADELTSGGVRLNRGAGAGWRTPSTSTKARRATACGCSGASAIDSTGAKQTSVPSITRHHSSRVLVLKAAVSRRRSSGHQERSCWWGRPSAAIPDFSSSSA